MRLFFAAAAAFAIGGPVSCDVPRNIYGAHLLVDNTGPRGIANLKWARYLVGRYGYAKTLMGDITRETRGAKAGWVDWVNECYKMDLIPICRLAGVFSGGWVKPEADADGAYKGMAEAVKSVVRELPKSDKLPLYIEVWNEPNLSLEWSGNANLPEYARFFVGVSRAIRSLGDSRVRILNGAFALSPEATEECCKADPEFINAFDVWASHPYPQNHPPEYNIHDGTARLKEHTIDSYLLETAVLEKYGRKDVKVMITETGYALGEDLFLDSEGYPAIDEFNRADYILRACRDYWEKWPEIVGVIPFEFSDPGWMRFNWVDPASDTRADGSPTKPHYQYTLVSRLAKPADDCGTVSGKATDGKYGIPLENVEIRTQEAPFSAVSDITGTHIRPGLKPGVYHLTAVKQGFSDAQATVTVAAGKNTVANFRLQATQPGSVSGKVLDAVVGGPVRGARITLTPGGASALTDTNGEFSIKDLPPVPFSAEATLTGYNSHKVARLVVAPGADTAQRFRIAKSNWPEAKNDCSNPSFETLTNPGGENLIAARWEIQGAGGAYKVTERVSHSGDRCQGIFATPGQDTMLRMISHYGYSKPGATYTAGVWVKTDEVIRGTWRGAYLSLDFQDNNGGTLESVVSTTTAAGSADWTYLQATGIAPQSQRISVVLHLHAQSGAAYFDDAYLAMVKPAR